MNIFSMAPQSDESPFQDTIDPNRGQEEKDTPPESSTEEQPKGDAPSQGGAKTDKPEDGGQNNPAEPELPFHANPRWKQMVADLEVQKAREQQLLEEIEGLKKSHPRDSNPSPEAPRKSEPIPQYFRNWFGDQAEAMWPEYEAAKAEEKAAWKREMVEELERSNEARKQQEAQESQKWLDFVANGVESVRQKFNVDLPRGSNDLKEYLDFMNEYMPTDANGNIDFVKGWGLFDKVNQGSRPQPTDPKANEKMEAKKKLADMTNGKPVSAPSDDSFKDMKTPKELRARSFSDLASRN